MPLFRRRDGRAEPAAPTGPPERVDVPSQLAAAAPSFGPSLVAGLLPAARLASHREPDAGMDVGQSKLGGAPDLPVNTPWPSWTGPDGTFHLMQFFAQVNLAVVASAVSSAGLDPLPLPAEGQMSFFADFDGHGDGSGLYQRKTDGVLVLYSPPRTPLIRYGLRIEPVPAGQLLPVGRLTWPEGGPNGTGPTGTERAALDALSGMVEGEMAETLPEGWHLVAAHQLCGHPRAGGDTIDELRPGGDWQVLLQIGSDENLEIAWGGAGGAGTLWWTARTADIAAGRWDHPTFIFSPA